MKPGAQGAHFHCVEGAGAGLIPGQGTKIPSAEQPGQKKKILSRFYVTAGGFSDTLKPTPSNVDRNNQ